MSVQKRIEFPIPGLACVIRLHVLSDLTTLIYQNSPFLIVPGTLPMEQY
jgi:hypothetical protein